MRFSRALAMLALAGLGLAFAGTAARGQEAGDTVVVTLTNGARYTGTLVSRSGTETVIRIGSSSVALSSTVVKSVEKAPAEGEAATGKAPAAPAAPAPAAPGGKSRGPLPAKVLLKDGTVLEGFLVGKEEGRFWFVQGTAQAIPVADIEEVFGDVLGAGNFALTGDAARDCTKLVEDLGSDDLARVRAARSALDGYGVAAVPAIVAGLKNRNPMIRQVCLSVIAAKRVQEGVDGVMTMIRADEDPVVRCAAAEAMAVFDAPVARRALLEAAWRDKDDRVKASATSVLSRVATVEESSALVDLLNILPPESKARPLLYGALRKATGEKLGDDGALWVEWWEAGGGRESIAERVNDAVTERIRRESRGPGAAEEEPAPPAPEGPPLPPSEEPDR